MIRIVKWTEKKSNAYVTKFLERSAFPEEAENLGFKWSTSNSKVAIVNNGTITAMGEGTCVITVKDYFGNYSATCTVTVGGTAVQDSAEEEKGCGSVVGLGSAALLGTAALVVFARKKED